LRAVQNGPSHGGGRAGKYRPGGGNSEIAQGGPDFGQKQEREKKGEWVLIMARELTFTR